MKKFRLFIFSVLIAVLVSFHSVRQSADNRMLKPGDEINGMVITTGVANVTPLQAFCSPALENEDILTVDCHVPPLSKLAIGYPFEAADQALQALDWSALTWQLSLDGHPLALEAFGLYTYGVPDLAPSPSPIREVFRQEKAWNAVLVNPTSGMHTLRGIARTGADAFTWIVNLTVELSLAR